jgi:cation diffusion facilitator CzcD-associated flavoprotein CzcO
MEHVARKYGVLPHCRFGCAVRGATWDEDAGAWKLALESGEIVEAEIVVSAIGMFNELVRREIAGLDSFAGTPSTRVAGAGTTTSPGAASR